MTAKQKLKSNRGATLLFAIVALAVAAIVSAVVIYAAESNAGRIRSAQASEQAQLTLNSAAALVREQYAGSTIELINTYTILTETTAGTSTETKNPGTVQVTFKKTDDNGAQQVLAAGNVSQAGLLSITQGSLSKLQENLLKWTIDVMNNAVLTQSGCTQSYLVKATGPEGNLENVKVTVQMQPGQTSDLSSEDDKLASEAEKYYLTVVFSMESTPAETITMTFMATVSESKSSSLVSKSSHTIQDSEGASVTVSSKEVKIEQKLKLSWTRENVVVNVVEKNGGNA